MFGADAPRGGVERESILKDARVACPLCAGKGSLSRGELLDRLGARDLRQVASLTAEETLRQALRQTQAEESRHREWYRQELARQAEALRQQHASQVQPLQQKLAGLEAAAQLTGGQKDLELAELRRKLGERDADLAEARTKLEKVSAIKGRVEELDFESEVRAWPEVELSEKQRRDGDFLLWLRVRDAQGNLLRAANAFVVDNKDDRLTTAYAADLVHASQKRGLPLGVLVCRHEEHLNLPDGSPRWSRHDDVWLLRTTRARLRRDLEVLRPILERLAQDGPGFLEAESVLAAEVTRTIADLDGVDAQLRKVDDAVKAVRGLCDEHRGRLEDLVRQRR